MSLQALKNIAAHTLIISFFCQSLCAGTLLFHPGDSASYSVSQIVNAEGQFMGFSHKQNSQGTLNFDIKILASNPETLSYPFDVELIVRRIQVSQIEQQEGPKPKIRQYDSANPAHAQKMKHTEQLTALINTPLHFRVYNEFDVVETTGLLEKTYKQIDDLSATQVFGTTPSSFELLLTQLFHLSGEEMEESATYPVSCYQFINWEEDKLDEGEIKVCQTSAYAVTSTDSETVQARWEGVASVKEQDWILFGLRKGTIIVDGDAKWNTANPLVQQRTLNVEIKARYPLIHQKISIQQVWESEPGPAVEE